MILLKEGSATFRGDAKVSSTAFTLQHGGDMISLLRKVGVCVLFILSLVWYGSTHFYRDPGSVFFDRTRAFEQRYSKHRKAESKTFIENFQSDAAAKYGAVGGRTNATLCVTSSSVNRKGSSYLEVRPTEGIED